MPGEGSVYRRQSDDRWVATISTGARGSRRITTVYRHSRSEALDALADLRKRHGRLDRSTTVGDYLERWVRDARDIRPTTRHGYAAVIEAHLAPHLGHRRLAALTPVHVETMLAELAPTMRPKTLRNILVVLRRALREAVRKGLVTANVAAPEYVDAPKVEAAVPDALTREEEAKILAVLPGEWIEPHVIVALGTGLRQGEQLGLTWADIGEAVRVDKELTRIRGFYETVKPKTPFSVRSVPLAPSVIAAIDRHRGALVAAGFVPIETGPVFVNSEGADLSGSVLTHRWYVLLAKAGVRRRPWKVLRATFGTRLREAGLDEGDISRLMGHAPGSRTTRRHYIAPAGLDPRDAIERSLTDTLTRTEAHGRVVDSRPGVAR